MNDNDALEAELRDRLARALDTEIGSVGVLIGIGLVLVKVKPRYDHGLSQHEKNTILSVLVATGLGGNLYHVLES